MWNKRETDTGGNQAPTAPSAKPPQRTAQTSPAPKSSGGSAVIGPSISIKGDLSGEEDLIIEGRVEGEVNLNQHSVTVGRSGRVSADVYGQSINVEGEVHGNLTGDHEVIIRNTGRVEGNIVAPRVTLEDGSSFRGAIDMQTPQASQQAAKQQRPQKQQKQNSSNKQSAGSSDSARAKGSRTAEATA